MTIEPLPDRPYRPPGRDALVIIHCDPSIIVAEKPHGLLSVPGRGEDRQVSALSYLEERFGQVRVVHRLDMDTSGLIVFARTGEAQAHLSRQFEERTAAKTYEALVAGRMAEASGVVDRPIGRLWEERPRRRIDDTGGKPALTRWERVGTVPSGSHLVLRPQTGRTHQLRVHLASIGHPILGDRLYGSSVDADRLCLHATELELRHPEHGRTVRFSSAAPFIERPVHGNRLL